MLLNHLITPGVALINAAVFNQVVRSVTVFLPWLYAAAKPKMLDTVIPVMKYIGKKMPGPKITDDLNYMIRCYP